MTMYVINPVQAVGAFLPNVYISNIILRSDTGYTKNEINPHIDYPGEGTVIRGDGSLQVELALTIKDVLGAGGTSQWFSAGALPGGDSLKDYIKVNIVQAYTADSVREWSGKMVSQNIYTDQAQLITGTGISYMSLDLSEFGTGDDLSRYITEFDKNGNAIKSISKTILSSDDEWLPGSANHSTNLPAEPTDLAYFVWTSINLDNLATGQRLIRKVPNRSAKSIQTQFIVIIKWLKKAMCFLKQPKTEMNWPKPTDFGQAPSILMMENIWEAQFMIHLLPVLNIPIL